ncbi:myosin heavy chain [Cystoisospora suis]|uniref:Myosin heavy chain n=1 Tax=Cystoisospora suis TaxID=483139 RepID=A0A2C6KI83_9APIC|nr:myosin heavy chain [Cystoisospora suis]
MDGENFKKLTAILDILDRYKRSLTAASYQGGGALTVGIGKTGIGTLIQSSSSSSLSVDTKRSRSRKSLIHGDNERGGFAAARAGSKFFPRRSTTLATDCGVLENAGGEGEESWPAQATAAIQRKMTLRRVRTLQIRRQQTIRASCPELPQIQDFQLKVSECI